MQRTAAMRHRASRRDRAEHVAEPQCVLYCFPDTATLTPYVEASQPQCLGITPSTMDACVRALVGQLAGRRLGCSGIEMIVQVTVARALRACQPDIPRYRAQYIVGHYTRRVVRYAVMRAPQTAMPPLSLSAHFSETGIFVME